MGLGDALCRSAPWAPLVTTTASTPLASSSWTEEGPSAAASWWFGVKTAQRPRSSGGSGRVGAGSSTWLAPEATAMAFSPSASTMTAATPAGARPIASRLVSTPAWRRSAGASRPKSSSPMQPTSHVRSPSRAAATAWLPSPKSRGRSPIAVLQARAGGRSASRSVRSARSEIRALS
jgi:hypothetical protein